MLPDAADTDEGPRWREAAARLVQALRRAEDDEQRLALLLRLARGLGQTRSGVGNGAVGDYGYPAFLKLLLIIGESANDQAQRQLADTLAMALRRMDLPSGSLTSWGAGAMPTATQTASMAQLSGGYVSTAPKRQLGPVEYLTVWYCQRTQRPYLGEDSFRRAMRDLIALLDRNQELRRLYPLKLLAEAADGQEGAFTRRTRDRLQALADAWQRGATPEAVADAALCEPALPAHWALRSL